jgi:hypothetical protein
MNRTFGFRSLCLLLVLLTNPSLGDENRPKLAALMSKGCIVYYGPEPRDKTNFTKAQVVILEPSHWSTRSLRHLREQGKIVLGYLSIGEIISTARTNRNYQILSRNSDWNSLRINPIDPAWKKNILRRTRLAKERELDGLMLDTIDITILHPECEDDMAGLVADIRKEMPERYLMVNRGFSILDRIQGVVDGVIFENANNSSFNDSDREWIQSKCQSLKQVGMPVLVLDYEEHSSLGQTKQMAEEFGWSFFLAPSQTLTRPLSSED